MQPSRASLVQLEGVAVGCGCPPWTLRWRGRCRYRAALRKALAGRDVQDGGARQQVGGGAGGGMAVCRRAIRMGRLSGGGGHRAGRQPEGRPASVPPPALEYFANDKSRLDLGRSLGGTWSWPSSGRSSSSKQSSCHCPETLTLVASQWSLFAVFDPQGVAHVACTVACCYYYNRSTRA